MFERTQKARRIPPCFSKALDLLDRITTHPDLIYSSERLRAMRPERRDSIQAVLQVFCRHANLQENGTVVLVFDNGQQAVPMTIEKVAELAKITKRNCERVFVDLKNAGFIETSQQVIHRENGKIGLLVSTTIKRLSLKFWRVLGLSLLYKQCVDYAKKHGKIILRPSFFRVVGKTVFAFLKGDRKNTVEEDKEHQKRVLEQAAAVHCLELRNGIPCAAPNCSKVQYEACLIFRENEKKE